MTPTPQQAHIIAKLKLRGTWLEQFVMTPGAVTDPDSYRDSPSLLRLALDVQRVLAQQRNVKARNLKSRRRRSLFCS